MISPYRNQDGPDKNRGEIIQPFAERIRSLDTEAYPNQNHNHRLIQDSLAGVLIDDVFNDHISS